MRTKSRQQIRMDFWKENVAQIITSNGFPLLTHAGSISHAHMEQSITVRYTEFDQQHRRQEAFQADQFGEAELKALEQKLSRRSKF
ncbi:MAG: virulence RhuM family protein [Chromatiales bacterium]|nr:virulence RhuM family protein [Chromatiales bacterium]